MDFKQGVLHMIALADTLMKNGNPNGSFQAGNLVITYPGYKSKGDYRLTENGTAPKHTDIVKTIYDFTNTANLKHVTCFLDDVYMHGLNATSTTFPQSFKEKIFWITLQEEINYPQPKFAGRKLPFQRFYEGALAKLGICSLEEVCSRTNNHGRGRPVLLESGIQQHPSFYI